MIKKLLMLVTLLGIVIISKAQTVGVLAQPNFDQEYVGTGFFAETTVIGDLGVYADYKLHIKSDQVDLYSTNRRQIDQVNLGISYRVTDIAKVVISTSVVHQVNYTSTFFDTEIDKLYTSKSKSVLGNTIGISGLFDIGGITGLVGYETNRSFSDNRITIGLGISLLNN